MKSVISRAGSHAGRGFHYQDAIGGWLVVRCWLGDLPYGEVIPEGRDDYELRGATSSALVQVKSRRNHLGPFPINEIADYIRALWLRAEAFLSSSDDLILLLERFVAEGPEFDYRLCEHPGLVKILSKDSRWGAFASRTRIWIKPAPFEEAVSFICNTMPCLPLAAQVYYGELLHKIGSLADANGLVKSGRFEGLTVSDVEASIRRLEPLLDLAGMEIALRDGYCDVIDFLTPTDEPAFYQGVDTRPGHLAAGLVAERPEARHVVLSELESYGTALIVGQSGAGKSALMWDTARIARHTIRWFEVKHGVATDVHLFIRFARALRASPTAPVGFVLDDVGRGLCNLWDSLVRESGVGNGILLLGSIREEDIFMLTSRTRTREVRLDVEEVVAERIWCHLKEEGLTSWVGWHEPWGYSKGLLLEYVHILTQGERLEAILRGQIECRLREARDLELAVLRITAFAGVSGAFIDTERLSEILGADSGDMARALRRLIDEHLIVESSIGQLGGLHQLRSATLCELCRAILLVPLSRTVAEAVDTVIDVNLEALAAYVAVNYPDETTALIKEFVARLEKDRNLLVAAAALAGLGQAHIELTLKNWIPTALLLGMKPTEITLAVMFAVAGTDLSSMPLPKHFQDTVRALQLNSAADPRLNLLEKLSFEVMSSLFIEADTTQIHAFLSALIGVNIPESVRLAIGTTNPDVESMRLREAAKLLGTVRLIDPQIAINWTAGEVCERLLARVAGEIPWADLVEIETTPEGRLLRSKIFHVAHSVQVNVHDEVVQLCECLFELDPTASIVAVDAISADGLPSGLLEMPLATKRIPRENSPPSTLPLWNKRWLATAARQVGTERYTDYLQRAYVLLEQLIPILERIVDSTLRGKRLPPKILEQFGEIHDASHTLTPPRDGLLDDRAPEQFSTPLQNLLFYSSAELIRRFINLPENFGSFVFWTGDLLKDVVKAQNEPWHLVGKSPEKLLQRLDNIIKGLRLLAAEAGEQNGHPVALWNNLTRRADRGNALRLVRLTVEEQLRKRSIRYLQQVQSALKKIDLDVELHTRPDWDSPLPWPNLELLVVVEIESPKDWQVWFSKYESQIRSTIGLHRRIWVVPRIQGMMVSRLTVGGVSQLLPLSYKVDDWLDNLQFCRLNDLLTRTAQPIFDLIIELDGIRHFGLGVEGRPTIEQMVQKEDEQLLESALVKFEMLAEGLPIQSIMRQLNEEVSAGHVALAEGTAALTHGHWTQGGEILNYIHHALLIQDIENALCASDVQK